MMQYGAAWLDEQQRTHVSRTVVYRRGTASVTLAATIGSSDGSVSLDYGARERWESRDYLVRAADLVLEDEVALPAVGDLIVETDGGKEFTYQVLQPSVEEPAYRYTDGHRIRLRIHTKLVATETAIP